MTSQLCYPSSCTELNILGQPLTRRYPCRPTHKSQQWEQPQQTQPQLPNHRKSTRHTNVTMSNVRTWMDPVKNVQTLGIPPSNEGPWLEHHAAPCCVAMGAVTSPCYDVEGSSSSRDYQYRGNDVCRSTRFSAQPCYARLPAIGGGKCMHIERCRFGNIKNMTLWAVCKLRHT